MIYMRSIKDELASFDRNSARRTLKIFKNIGNYEKNLNTDDPRFKGGNFDDALSIKLLEMLRKKKHRISFRSYIAVWYYIWDSYNDLNRMSVFKESLSYIDSKIVGGYDTKLSWCAEEFDVYRVGTVNGRSWSSAMKDTLEYYKCWVQNNKNHQTLAANIYKKTIKQEDILIMCDSNLHKEQEIILKKEALKNYSNIERLNVSSDSSKFVVTTKDNDKLCAFRFAKNAVKHIRTVESIDSDSTMIRVEGKMAIFIDNKIEQRESGLLVAA